MNWIQAVEKHFAYGGTHMRISMHVINDWMFGFQSEVPLKMRLAAVCSAHGWLNEIHADYVEIYRDFKPDIHYNLAKNAAAAAHQDSIDAMSYIFEAMNNRHEHIGVDFAYEPDYAAILEIKSVPPRTSTLHVKRVTKHNRKWRHDKNQSILRSAVYISCDMLFDALDELYER